jgi:hypothetical protein
MFSRLTILLFVFFAVAALVLDAEPPTRRVAEEMPVATAATQSSAVAAVDDLMTGTTAAQP